MTYGKELTDDELAELNRRDFSRHGCKWHNLTDKKLADTYALCRIWSGGDTGALTGYERVVVADDIPELTEEETKRLRPATETMPLAVKHWMGVPIKS